MMWATSVLILVFLGLSVLELGPMYAIDRRQTRASLNTSALWGRRHNNTVLLLAAPCCSIAIDAGYDENVLPHSTRGSVNRPGSHSLKLLRLGS